MIIIKKACNINGKRYEVGKEYKPKKGDMDLIIRMNEKGFIEPLSKNELLEINNSFILSKKSKIKESENNDSR